MRRPGFALSVLALLLAPVLPACTFEVPVATETTAVRPVGTEQIALDMGVYYGPEFSSYRHTQTVGGGHRLSFPIGQSSAAHFDKVFPALFRQARAVGGRPPLAEAPPGLDAVIETRIEDVSVRDPALVGWAGTFDVRITYRFTLYTLAGHPVASWTVTGAGRDSGAIDLTGMAGSNKAAEAANRAVEDAGKSFMVGFAGVPEVRRWLSGRPQSGARPRLPPPTLASYEVSK